MWFFLSIYEIWDSPIWFRFKFNFFLEWENFLKLLKGSHFNESHKCYAYLILKWFYVYYSKRKLNQVLSRCDDGVSLVLNNMHAYPVSCFLFILILCMNILSEEWHIAISFYKRQAACLVSPVYVSPQIHGTLKTLFYDIFL